MSCRICLESDGVLISPCGCKGSTAYVHQACIREWVNVKQSDTCEICKQQFYKEEHCSYEPKKCLHACCVFDEESVFQDTLTMTVWITLFLSIMLGLSDIENFIFINAIATVACSVCAFIYGCLWKKSIHNLIFFWKISVSFPYLFYCLMEFFSNVDRCDLLCMRVEEVCDANCIYYRKYEQSQHLLDTTIAFDLINFIIIVSVRVIFLCFVHMRNVTLRDRPAERERLLSDLTEETDV